MFFLYLEYGKIGDDFVVMDIDQLYVENRCCLKRKSFMGVSYIELIFNRLMIVIIVVLKFDSLFLFFFYYDFCFKVLNF